ncbi:MAG TPA: hypothetical protein VKL19_10000 [Thermoanaerobaculia bacterium]|nr:hypothetical protein [Thermoanaerobaculia bacterium]
MNRRIRTGFGHTHPAVIELDLAPKHGLAVELSLSCTNLQMRRNGEGTLLETEFFGQFDRRKGGKLRDFHHELSPGAERNRQSSNLTKQLDPFRRSQVVKPRDTIAQD